MDPAVEGSRPEPLQPGVTYRLFVAAGKIKGQHDFQIGAPPANSGHRTANRSMIRRLWLKPGYAPRQSSFRQNGTTAKWSFEISRNSAEIPFCISALRNRTARMKRTTARWMNRRRHIARQNNSFAFRFRINFRHGGNQRLRVRMLRVAN